MKLLKFVRPFQIFQINFFSSIEPKLFIFGIIHNDELTSERITEAENIVIFFMESYKHFIFIFFDFFEEFIPWNDIAVSSH